MIYGIGTDLCEIARIAKALECRGERFAQHVLGTSELAVFRTRIQKVPQRGLKYLATRFAAKEAFSKAIGLGLRMPMTWRCCEVLNKASGEPYIVLHDELNLWFEHRKLQASVSITDESSFAMAFVVVEVIQ